MASACLSLDWNSQFVGFQGQHVNAKQLTEVFSFILGPPVQRRPLLLTAEHLARQTFKNLKVGRNY